MTLEALLQGIADEATLAVAQDQVMEAQLTVSLGAFTPWVHHGLTVRWHRNLPEAFIFSPEAAPHRWLPLLASEPIARCLRRLELIAADDAAEEAVSSFLQAHPLPLLREFVVTPAVDLHAEDDAPEAPRLFAEPSPSSWFVDADD